MNSLSLDTLQGVSETLLIPLFCRVWEHEETRPLLRDDVAHGIGMRLQPLLEASAEPFHQAIARRRWPETIQVLMALRTHHFDRVSRDFIARHPNAQVVMLGCGLDSRYERLGRPDVPWFNLDLPEVMRLRQSLFGTEQAAGAQVRSLAISALDPAWIEALDPLRPTLVLAEGLLMYLPRAQIRALLRLLAAALHGELLAEVVAESTRVLASRIVLQLALRVKAGTDFAGGLTHPREPESWDPGLRLLGEWSYFDQNEPRLGLFRLGGLTPFRKAQSVIHYRLGQEAN